MTALPPTMPCRAALLVFHGIGEQDPYQPLDAFVRGLKAAVQLPTDGLEHQLTWEDGRPITAIRLKLPPSPSGWTELDISEFYWAPMVQGRIALRQVLVWLFQTGIRPLYRWADQPGLLRPANISRGRQAQVFGWTLLRSLFLLLLALGLIWPFAYAGLQRDAIMKALKTAVAPALAELTAAWLPTMTVAILLFLTCCLGLSARALLWGGRDAKHALNPKESRWWGRASAVAALGFGLGAVWFLATTPVAHGIGALIGAVFTPALLLSVGVLVLTLGLSWPLVHFVGDVPLYVTRNERSAYYRTRQEILEQSTRRVKALLADGRYEAVYLAGHSLGSVIGYDTINCLARELRATSPNPTPSRLTRHQFDKLRGLLTFGSPLDKIYYFFRARVGDEELVRAQLESSLHGFRRESSGRDYGECKIVYEVPEPRAFKWVNVRGRLDFVAGHLDYHRVDGSQPCLRYLNPFKAHTRYWNDHQGFYPEVARWLDLAPASGPVPTLVTRIKRISRNWLRVG